MLTVRTCHRVQGLPFLDFIINYLYICLPGVVGSLWQWLWLNHRPWWQPVQAVGSTTSTPACRHRQIRHICLGLHWKLRGDTAKGPRYDTYAQATIVEAEAEVLAIYDAVHQQSVFCVLAALLSERYYDVVKSTPLLQYHVHAICKTQH
jgi:hypothetical protein